MDLEEQYDKIYRYCYFKLKHRQMAEDVTQETFLRFLENRSYCDRGKKIQYLYTVARNLCMDVYRRKQTERLPEEETERSGDGPEEKVINRIAMKNALARLEKEEQELLLLRYVQELSVSDISGILEISRFSVYRRTEKALKRLRDFLNREGFGEEKKWF